MMYYNGSLGCLVFKTWFHHSIPAAFSTLAALLTSQRLIYLNLHPFHFYHLLNFAPSKKLLMVTW
jgi:hypothetical protein